MYDQYPLDYLRTTRVVKGPAAANFQGKFTDKEMIEVDRTGGPGDGNVYLCWTKFPAFGESTVYFSRSTDHGLSFSRPVAVSKEFAGQGCDIAVEHDGDVYVSWRDFELSSSKKNFGVSVARSSDQGLTWNRPVKVANLPAVHAVRRHARLWRWSRCLSERVRLRPGAARTEDDVGPDGGARWPLCRGPGERPEVDRRELLVLLLGGPRTRGSRRHHAVPFDGQRPPLVRPVRRDIPDAGASVLPGCRCVRRRARRSLAGQPRGSRVLPAATDREHGGRDVLRRRQSSIPTWRPRPTGRPSAPICSSRAPATRWSTRCSMPPACRSTATTTGFRSWPGPTGTSWGTAPGPTTGTSCPATDPREETQDGFDVKGCWQTVDGVLVRTCFNGGGYDQNIYGNSVSIG